MRRIDDLHAVVNPGAACSVRFYPGSPLSRIGANIDLCFPDAVQREAVHRIRETGAKLQCTTMVVALMPSCCTRSNSVVALDGKSRTQPCDTARPSHAVS